MTAAPREIQERINAAVLTPSGEGIRDFPEFSNRIGEAVLRIQDVADTSEQESERKFQELAYSMSEDDHNLLRDTLANLRLERTRQTGEIPQKIDPIKSGTTLNLCQPNGPGRFQAELYAVSYINQRAILVLLPQYNRGKGAAVALDYGPREGVMELDSKGWRGYQADPVWSAIDLLGKYGLSNPDW